MKDLTRFATATATPTMEAFADYLVDAVFGGTLPTGIDSDSFRKGVALGGSTRGYFQASDAWKSDPRNYLANVEANRAKVAEDRLAKAKASRAKAEERERAAIAKLEDAVAAAKAKAEALASVGPVDVSEVSEDVSEVSEDVSEDGEDGEDGSDESRAIEAARAATEDGTRRSRRAA